MDVSANRYFSAIATGNHRFAAHFSIPYPSDVNGIVKFVERRTAETPLRFSGVYFRRPKRDTIGAWNCRWIEHCTITDATGCRVVNNYYPARQQINIPYLHYWLNVRQFTPLMKVSFRSAFPNLRDSPVATHVERLWDVLDWETAKRDNMLTDNRNEAESGLFAIIEHTTGLVLPLAIGTRTEFIVDDSDTMTIRVLPASSYSSYRSLNGHERYEQEGTYSEQQLHDDIERWSRELSNQIAQRDTEAFAAWCEAIDELKEKTLDNDRANY